MSGIYDPEYRTVRCQACQCALGRLETMDGETVLHIGGVDLTRADGRCAACGTAWHWSASEQDIARLTAREAKRRGNDG